MNNPYFPNIKDAPVRTAIYTPVLPLGWNVLPEWLNPQSLIKKNNAKKVQIKTPKKSFSISAKSAKKNTAPEIISSKPPISLKPFFLVSILCTSVLIGIFFYVKKTK